jgi:hypothetical protein
VASVRSSWLVVLAFASIACAGGAEPNKGPFVASVGSGPGGATAASGGSEDPGGESTAFPDETLGEGDGGELEGEADDGPAESSTSALESSSDGGASSTGAGEDTGTPSECPQLATCATATVIGMVSGDVSSNDLTTMGSAPTWLSFQVTEDNDAVTGEAVSFTARLDSPPGVDFDLFVHLGAPSGATGCNGMLQQSTSAGAEDVVHMSWGEGAVANGGDDRAWVAVEIVPKDECDGLAQWTLTIEGDT